MDSVGLCDLDVDEAGCGESGAVLLVSERSGDAAGPARDVFACGVVHVLLGDDVGDGNAPTGAKDPGGFGEHEVLVTGEVDDAVGDDDIDTGVGQGDVLEVALEELDVRDTRLLGIAPCELEHLGGHVEPDRPAPWGDAPS